MHRLAKGIVERPVANGEYAEVEVVYAPAIIADAFGKNVWPSYAEQGNAIREFCADNNAHYYAADRERFFISTGADEALAAGKHMVVVEDLS